MTSKGKIENQELINYISEFSKVTSLLKTAENNLRTGLRHGIGIFTVNFEALEKILKEAHDLYSQALKELNQIKPVPYLINDLHDNFKDFITDEIKYISLMQDAVSLKSKAYLRQAITTYARYNERFGPLLLKEFKKRLK